MKLPMQAFLALAMILTLTVAPGAVFESAFARAADAPSGPTVGMEGRLEVTLPGPRLEARPVTDRSPMVLRIADAAPHGTLTRYDLRYTGLRPGSYDLRDFLLTPEGATPAQLPPLPVRITGLLPPKHDGRLIAAPDRGLPIPGGYRRALTAVAVVWIVGLAGWLWTQRRRRNTEISVEPAGEPTLADRLRPLVESAARGELPPEGQAQLERLLLGHWRQRLGWESLPMEDALMRLHQHPEAGALLRDLEGWLHRPRGAVAVDVPALLAPYRGDDSSPAPLP